MKKSKKKPAPKGDTTRTARSQRRQEKLNKIAIKLGYPSWRKYETFMINTLIGENGEVKALQDVGK